uniref:Uncharacterized protein n=1 Tax=Glossina pallidipes TaxID=7398 RepID=A0A1A9ZEC2_GLOPL
MVVEDKGNHKARIILYSIVMHDSSSAVRTVQFNKLYINLATLIGTILQRKIGNDFLLEQHCARSTEKFAVFSPILGTASAISSLFLYGFIKEEEVERAMLFGVLIEDIKGDNK